MFKVGIEVHQQLNTGKLFCNCPSEISDREASLVVRRKLRATESEMGEIDPAALLESLRDREFFYEADKETSCLVELDEEPPGEMNREALEVAIQVSLMLGLEPVDEIHVMRKIVIDGSNTTGFQRTAIVSMGEGIIETSKGEVRVKSVCLEEESARIMETTQRSARYRLDRLGIPLIEVSTYPDITEEGQAREVAEYIGEVLRATGKVRRGIGTIRQDLNVSIEGGSRQEIKGVQELDLIEEVIRREVMRQKELLRIREILRERGARVGNPVDVTEVFLGTKSKILRREISSGGKVMSIPLFGFSGVLGKEIQPGRRLGTELANYSRVYGGIPGIFHTDELPGYGISEEEVKSLYHHLGIEGKEDAAILVAGKEPFLSRSLEAVMRRVKLSMEEIPEETRKALPDGNTEFMRPLPGAARMYPETDVPPIPIHQELINKIRLSLPELPREKAKKLISLGLREELANRLVRSEYLKVFEEAISSTNLSPNFIASFLLDTLKSLRREGVDLSSLRESDLLRLFELNSKGLLNKEGMIQVIKLLSKGEGGMEDLINRFKLVPEEEIRKIISEVVLKRARDLLSGDPSRISKKLVGEVMKRVGGRADGRKVYEILLKEVEKLRRRAQ